MRTPQEARRRDARREQSNRDELAERLGRALTADGRIEPLKGMSLIRFSTTTEPVHGVTQPSFCVIAQGSKEVYLGEERYQYDPYNYLIATVELPIASQVIAASEKEPYLGLVVTLEPSLVGSVLVEIDQMAAHSPGDAKAIAVSALDTSLLDAVVRLVRLLDCPTEARLLQPLITREIVYRLLAGAQGERLRQMTVLGGHTHRIAQSIKRIRQEFNQLLHINDLAKEVGMSVSSFHHYFKEVTAMSPLQYQKQLRLQEARRLMLGGDVDAASAGYRVGYEDASHFNREYKRLFGEPPIRDVERLKETAMAHAEV